MQNSTNNTERQQLKQECLALSDEKIKIAMQLEKEIKKSINFLNKKINLVQTEMSKHKPYEQPYRPAPSKVAPKRFIKKKERKARNYSASYKWKG